MGEMHIDQQPYRDLYDAILSYEGGALFADVVRPWLGARDDERRWLDALRVRAGAPVPPLAQEESWRLYALSRILQLLQLSFAPHREEGGWNVPTVTRDELAAFMDTLGLEAVEARPFHPFHHEIVVVDEMPDAGAPPRVVEEYWPGCRVGPLLLSRAGCRVAAGRDHLVKEIAERSTLYWAFARGTRRTEDLSGGWGGNSQWRTDIRRDYEVDGALHYNVGASSELPGGDGLTAAERAELLRHRCFVTSARPSEDLWPYALHLVENA
jgi:hypothetical protein